jgi:hypothetical protein
VDLKKQKAQLFHSSLRLAGVLISVHPWLKKSEALYLWTVISGLKIYISHQEIANSEQHFFIT